MPRIGCRQRARAGFWGGTVRPGPRWSWSLEIEQFLSCVHPRTRNARGLPFWKCTRVDSVRVGWPSSSSATGPAGHPWQGFAQNLSRIQKTSIFWGEALLLGYRRGHKTTFGYPVFVDLWSLISPGDRGWRWEKCSFSSYPH